MFLKVSPLANSYVFANGLLFLGFLLAYEAVFANGGLPYSLSFKPFEEVVDA